MAKWKNLFRHVTANVDSGGDAARGTDQTENEAKVLLFSKYDMEYIRYCIEQEQVVSALEAQLHTSDDPKEIAIQTLKTACTFYGGDWAGILEVDLDLDLWTPVWWYNAGLKDRTTQLVHEFETAAIMPTWIECMERGECIVIPDVGAVKEEHPDEYAVYRRLRVQSVIAAPFAPNPIGFLVIRNPSRYVRQASMMSVLAYVLHRAMAQQKTIDSVRLAPSPDSISGAKDVVINFFGDMEIYTRKGVLRERDFNAPKSSRVITYLMLNRKTAHPPLEIYSELWPDDCCDPETVGRNVRGYIYRFRQAFALISDFPLIEATPTGYRINPDLNIITDLDQFDRLCDASHNEMSVARKVDFMKKAVGLYRGPLFKSAHDEHWIIGQVTHYHLRYISLTNELMSTLATAKDFYCVQHYAVEAISHVPGNLKAYYWLVVAMYHLGTVDLVQKELVHAKEVLTHEEYEILMSYLKQSQDIDIETLTL